MDPALQELAAATGAEEIEAIIKLRVRGEPPPHVRLVSTFGDVATCRLAGDRVEEVWAHPTTLSLKAPRLLAYERELALSEESEDIGLRPTDGRRPTGLDATGRGVVIGAIDWGVDVAHPDLLRPDGSSRLLAVWDQRQRRDRAAPEPYGYGVVHRHDAIDAALASGRVYEALGFHPEEGDPLRNGAHGTHVLGIAAGNGAVPGSPVGLAPEADLVFVHLSAGRLGGLATLGDSVRILEALDFIRRTAGARPWVVNTSLGRHSGGHRGLTLVEQGMDALLREAPGRAIVQSCGNYYLARAHACGRLAPGRSRVLTWQTGRADVTPNELEVWYSQRDQLGVVVSAPIGNGKFRAGLGEITPIVIAGEEVGRIYHRRRDPTGEHHVDIFLLPGAPSGDWLVELSAVDVVDGRFDAYVERDAGCPDCQSAFHRDDSEPRRTLGSICNGFHTLAVGAYDGHDPDRPLGPFSSSGPTRDGRHRPNLVAPGVAVLSARSASRAAEAAAPITRKTGTSMAAPHVTGTIALMFEVAPRPLGIRDTHRLLLSTTEPAEGDPDFELRVGTGYLDTVRAVESAAGAIARPDSAEEKGVPMGERKGETPVVTAHSVLVEDAEAGVSASAAGQEGPQTTAVERVEADAFECEDGAADWRATNLVEEQELEEVLPIDEVSDPPIEAGDQPSSPLAARDAEGDWYVGEDVVAQAPFSEALVQRARNAMASMGVRGALGPDTEMSPALLFDGMTCLDVPGLCDQLERHFEVLALPGDSLEERLQPGDVVVVRALGEGSLAQAEVVVEQGPGALASAQARVVPLEGAVAAESHSLLRTEPPGTLNYRALPVQPVTEAMPWNPGFVADIDTYGRTEAVRCGFAGNGVVRTEAQVRAAVVNAAQQEWRRWHNAAGRRIRERVAGQFGHLVRYCLGAVGRIRPEALTAMSGPALRRGFPWGELVAANPTLAQLRSAAPAARSQLLREAGIGSPGNLAAIVDRALKNAARARLWCPSQRELRRNPLLVPCHPGVRSFAWSAVWVSACVRDAAIELDLEWIGPGAQHFGRNGLLRYATAHRIYSLEAYRRRSGATYQAFDVTLRVPRIGDIIVQDRRKGIRARDVPSFRTMPRLLQPRQGLPTHGDIVVEVAAHHVVTIGGNLGQSCLQRRYPLDANGLLERAAGQRYAQENARGVLPPVPAPRAVRRRARLHGSSTARIFTLLSPVEACYAVPGTTAPGGGVYT